MNIEEALELLRNDYVEKDIDDLSAKDRLLFWSNLEEFVRPKLMRGNVVAETDDNEKNITIKYIQ